MPSAQKALIFLCLFFLCLNIALFIFIDDIRWLGYQFVISSFAIAIIVHSKLFLRWRQSLFYVHWFELKGSEVSFVLKEDGTCLFNHGSERVLLAASNVTFWGYLLLFRENNKIAKKFIFKDSLSAQDNARLSRIILRIKKSG